MATHSGLAGIWEDLNNYLTVNVEVYQDEAPDTELPAIINFTVTNNGEASEDRPEIIFEEVQLKVGIPPEWSIHTATNLGSDQSFVYEHHCSYFEVVKIQWLIEGKVSPDSLLKFRRRPVKVSRNQQLPVKTYFDFLEQMHIQDKLEDKISSWDAPGPETTLSEMKEKENVLGDIITEIRESEAQLQEFLSFINFKKEREDILRHRNIYQEFLKSTERGVIDLIQVVKAKRPDGYDKLRNRVLSKLSTDIERFDNVTTELKKKLGLITEETKYEEKKDDKPVTKIPAPIPLKEIDLHGNNLEQVIPIVNKFLEECYKENVRRVRIVHGKGIFVLQKAIREILTSHKLVKVGSITSAEKDHGGEGATEANLIEFSTDNLD
ncbi:Smr/MutS family protein [Chloroflexota bacterium]